MKWIYTAMIGYVQSCHMHVCPGLAVSKKGSSEKTHKCAETCLPDDFIAFCGTPTGALEILLNITPIEEFRLAEAVRGSYRITVSGL